MFNVNFKHIDGTKFSRSFTSQKMAVRWAEWLGTRRHIAQISVHYIPGTNYPMVGA